MRRPDEPDTLASTRDITANATVVAGASTPGSTMDSGTAPTVLSNRWEIVGMLGAGGMGTVYRARDRELDELVALKVLHGTDVGPVALERFRREVKLARRVTHKNVARVHELGEHEGRRFFTMELVDGESLAAVLERTGCLSIGRAVSIATAIANGLAAAHEVGVVHRDLKPDNVLIGKDGRIAITDFGIAASVEAETASRNTTSFAGTPVYMAPEQVDRQRPIDARSDLYAFGIVLSEMLTGEPPFSGETSLAVAVARLQRPAPDPRMKRPELPAALAELINALLARDPDARPSSATAVLTTLESIGVPAASRPLATAPSTNLHPTVEAPVGMSGMSVGALPLLLDDRATKLAVLPVLNGSGPSEAFLADGFTDDLIDGLATVKRLHVLSRSMVARFGGRRDVDPRAVGGELDVDVVAEGSLRRTGPDKLRLGLRLISAVDGLQLWSRRFDVTDAELLAVSDEAANAIAAALTSARPRTVRKVGDANAVAAYLRARAAHRDFSPEGARRAVALFQEGLAIAPDDPLLVAGHAIALARNAFFAGDTSQPLLASARRAVELAPSSGEAHLAMSAAYLQAGQPKDSLRYAVEAISRAPSLAEAHLNVGRMLSEIGPLSLAERFLQTAAELDAVNPMTHIDQARILGLTGRLEEAQARVAEVVRGIATAAEATSARVVAARLAGWGRDEAVLAREVAEMNRYVASKTVDASLGRIVASLASIFDDTVPLPSAEELDRGATTAPSRRGIFTMQLITESACRRGDLDVARDALRRAVTAGLYDTMWLEQCPVLDVVRADARVAELRAEVAGRADEIRKAVPIRT